MTDIVRAKRKPLGPPPERRIIWDMATTKGPQTAAEAFAVADWKRLIPQLNRIAHHLLKRQGFVEGESKRSAVLEPDELVNRAVESLLSEERSWVPGAGKTQESLASILVMTMKSIASHARAEAAVARREAGIAGDREMERAADRRAGPHKLLAARAIIEEAHEVISDDRELVELFDFYRDGETKREDIAKKHGWSTDRVKVAQKRMRRLLDRKGITLDGSDEPQAPEEFREDRENDEVES